MTTPTLEQFTPENRNVLKRRAGRKYAALENGALAGMAEMPEVPTGCDNDPAFEAGYHEWQKENEQQSPEFGI